MGEQCVHAELLEALEALIEERTQDVPLLPKEQVEQFKKLLKKASEVK